MEDLSDKCILITGASSGIGEATALRLAEAGAKVAIAARRRDRLDGVAERIEVAGGEALVLETDVQDRAQAEAMVERTLKAFGRLDVMVNNAGVAVGQFPFLGSDPDNWRQMYETNVLGALYGVEPALAAMKRQGAGQLIFVSSGAGRWLYPGAPVYSSTKFALSTLAESIRRELTGDCIRVTSIEPGVVMTEIFENLGGDEARQAAIDATGGTPLQSEDIAETILFAVTRPPHVNLNILTVYPTGQAQ